MNAVRRLLTICLAISFVGIGIVIVAVAAPKTPAPKTPAAHKTPAPKKVQITFVLVNDIYLMNDQLMADGKRRGGFARLAAVVQAERAKGRKEGRHVVFAHAGDTISPSLMSGIDQGAGVVRLLNMVPPDIFVPGNHEFDFGKAVFLKRMAEAKFPRYAANLRAPDDRPIAGFKDRAILSFGAVKVGVTGAVTTDTLTESSPEDLKIAPVLEAISGQAAALRREGADFVVAVVHIDRKEDLELFVSRNADLILSGHDHDLFVTFDGRTALVESSSDAEYVTAVDITVTITEIEGKRQVAWWPRFRIIDTATVQPDPRVLEVVSAYERTLAKALNATIGTTAVALDSRGSTVRTGEAAIGNLIADAFRAATGADAAVINGGSIRANKLYAAGSAITRSDLLAEMPFGNHVALIEISGKALREAIESGLSALPQTAGRFPQVSGLTIEADPLKPPGERVLSMKVGGEPLQDTKMYKVATNDFLARGGDGYVTFRDAKQLIRDFDGPLAANEVMVFVRKIGTVRSGVEGRLVLK